MVTIHIMEGVSLVKLSENFRLIAQIISKRPAVNK